MRAMERVEHRDREESRTMWRCDMVDGVNRQTTANSAAWFVEIWFGLDPLTRLAGIYFVSLAPLRSLFVFSSGKALCTHRLSPRIVTKRASTQSRIPFTTPR
jgi:hypothetical protein